MLDRIVISLKVDLEMFEVDNENLLKYQIEQQEIIALLLQRFTSMKN